MRPTWKLQVEMLLAVPSPEGWLGLALYRESLGLNSVAYKVLGFLEIINIRYSDEPSQKRYINGALPFLDGRLSGPRLSVFQQQHPDVGAYLYESGRYAVAHASIQPLVNPDNTDDIARLNADVDLIRDLARHYIKYELGARAHRPSDESTPTRPPASKNWFHLDSSARDLRYPRAGVGGALSQRRHTCATRDARRFAQKYARSRWECHSRAAAVEAAINAAS